MNWKQAVTAMLAVAVTVLLVCTIAFDLPWEPEPRGVGLLTLLEWVITVAVAAGIIGWLLRDGG